MPRLVIVLDVELPPTHHDPHEIADSVLLERFATFTPGQLFTTDDGITGTFVSAEWES